MKTITTAWVTLVVALAASSSPAGPLNGTLKVGSVILDEEGDRSAVQETYNVYDGFAISQIRLDGSPGPRSYVLLDLRDINLDSRQGDFAYRIPGAFQFTAGYDQNRQVFDPGRSVNSERKDWRIGARVTPGRWFSASGSLGLLTREGDRLSHPLATAGVLGVRYDNTLLSGQLTLEAHKDRRGGAVSYRVSDYTDDLNPGADRKGQVVSARLYAPTPFYDKWTHLLRGSYGVRKLSDSDIEYTLAGFQYTGVVQPAARFQLRYNFDASRVDHDSTRLQTDRFQNNLDAAYSHRYGRISAGYGYETNDDDRTLTSYQSWRAGASFRYQKQVSAKVDYESRVKKDQEELTLLKDVEASRVRGSLEVRPLDRVVVGGGYSKREREFPDIGVTVDGEVMSALGRYDHPGWGSVTADYSYSTDEYTDLVAGFKTDSHVATGRAEFNRIRNLKIAGGATYLDIGRDLDIEKSMVFVEAALRVLKDYQLEVKYNVYNYDDYVLLDRYYTANVVRINLVYDLHLK